MHVGIHGSVGAVFPPGRLESALAGLDAELSVVSDSADCDGVVTFAHEESLLETDWIHSFRTRK